MEFFKKLLLIASISIAFFHTNAMKLDTKKQSPQKYKISPTKRGRSDQSDQEEIAPTKKAKKEESLKDQIDAEKEFTTILSLQSFIKDAENFKLFLLAKFAQETLNSGKLELARFVQKHIPTKDICLLIEKNKKTFTTVLKAPQKEAVHGWYIKNDICRLINAERLRACIKTNNLENDLDVAEKYVYPIKNKLRVFAKQVIPAQTQEVSEDKIQKLAIIIKQSGYKDIKSQNIMRAMTPDKTDPKSAYAKLVFIDTDEIAFLKISQKDYWNAQSCFIELLNAVTSGRLKTSNTAKTWIEKQYELDHKPITNYSTIPLPYRTDRLFDNPDIDYEKVKKEVKK